MARILCGVMGDALGHVGEALALSQAMPGHRFLFLGGGVALKLRQAGLEVEPLPLLGTAYRHNRVDLIATLGQGALALLGLAEALAGVERAIRRFKPDLVLSLFEAFTQLAARRLGLPCLSLDHQHFLTQCQPLPVAGQETARALLRLSLQATTSWASGYLVHSFFTLRPRHPVRCQVFPPLLSPELRGPRPSQGGHALVYQTSSTFQRLLPALRQWGEPCLVYGLGQRPARGNLVFRPPERRAFLADLAACRFLVANGGHNAISEALYLGKPVLALPIALAYEQYANACMLRQMGLGDYSLGPAPDPELFRGFAGRLGEFQDRLAGRVFFGTELIAKRLEEVLRGD
jgi:uncharacterized protein (TIGR00661 family)